MSGSHLKDQEIKEFFNQGFVVRRKVFSKYDLSLISQCFDRTRNHAKQFSSTVIDQNSQFVVEGERIDRIVWICGIEPLLKKISNDIKITGPCSQILGSRKMVQLICQAHYKLPGDQVEFEWHQDSQHRGYGSSDWQDINGSGSFVQTLVAVDPTPLESGPLFFVPASHKEGHLALDEKDNYNRLVDETRAVPLILEPGDVAFFHPYVIHGSKPNNSQHSRRVFINGFAYPGANFRKYPGCGLGEELEIANREEVAAQTCNSIQPVLKQTLS